MNAFYRAQREEVFEHYGGAVCSCCGLNDPIFLTLDHIDNQGAEHRRSISSDGSGKGVNLYR